MPRTTFRPETDGFAFSNNYWNLSQGELGSVRAAFDGAAVAAVALVSLWFIGVGGGILAAGVAATVAVWIASGSPIQYGLCGGMAFAALDYFRLTWVVPQGTSYKDEPTSPGPGAPLRAYIWQRLLDSLGGNASTFLGWMIVNKLVPSFWPFNGGSGWLLSQTKKQWMILKAHIDGGDPWPVGLVNDGIDPFTNHQVLVYGYNDPGDGTGSLFLYDNNRPSLESQIDFNLNGGRLVTPRDDTGIAPLGFFCENYSPSIPPVAVGLSQGLSASPAGPVNQGATVTFSMTAKNYGYRDSTSLMLVVSGPSSVTESGLAPIAFGGTRQLQGPAQLSTPGSQHFAAMCFLRSLDGIDIWKSLPAVEPGTAASVDVEVLKPKDKEKEKEHGKDTKDRKDVKDTKEGHKEGKEGKEGGHGHEVPVIKGGSDLAKLKEAFEGAPTPQHSVHFIVPELRPDLSTSALAGEPGVQKAPFKMVKDTKDFEKPTE